MSVRPAAYVTSASGSKVAGIVLAVTVTVPDYSFIPAAAAPVTMLSHVVTVILAVPSGLTVM